MNSKQAKRIRRNVRTHLERFLGVRNGEITDTSLRDRSYDRLLVDSKTYDATVNGEKHKDKALQIRLTTGSPRQVYKAVKARVQSNRPKKRKRVLRRIRVRPDPSPGAVEHTGTESLQP